MTRKLDTHEYHAVTRWRVEATRDEVAAISRRPEDLARWWPSAFLRSQSLNMAEEWSAGLEFACHVKGWLPYTLDFTGTVEEAVYGERFRVSVSGDFEGGMSCAIQEDGAYCRIEFDWRVRVNKPVVRRLSFVLKLLFYSNHLWVMTNGLKSINRELARLRADRSLCLANASGAAPETTSRMAAGGGSISTSA